MAKNPFKTAPAHTATKAQPTPSTSSERTAFLDQIATSSHTTDDIFEESEDESKFGNFMTKNTISQNQKLFVLNKIPNKGITISLQIIQTAQLTSTKIKTRYFIFHLNNVTLFKFLLNLSKPICYSMKSHFDFVKT